VFSCRGHGAPPRRLESCPWLPGGCAERTWRGRTCLRHGCGPRTPPRAQGMAVGQPSRMGGRCDALESLGVYHPGSPSLCKSSVSASWASSRAGFCRWTRRTPRLVVPAVSVSCRLPGRCATRHARGRERACRPGRRTPVPCRGQTCGRPSRRDAMRAPPAWVLSATRFGRALACATSPRGASGFSLNTWRATQKREGLKP
jgi:hypothetical protein